MSAGCKRLRDGGSDAAERIADMVGGVARADIGLAVCATCCPKRLDVLQQGCDLFGQKADGKSRVRQAGQVNGGHGQVGLDTPLRGMKRQFKGAVGE